MRLKSKLRAVQQGDLVDIIAPGFAPSEEELDQGIRFLEAKGFRTRVPKGLIGEDVLCAASDRARFEQFEKALTCRESSMIWCARGGYGALRLIPFMDRSRKIIGSTKKMRNAKPLFGFSDISSIQLWLLQNLGWPSFHGPVLERLGRALLPSTVRDVKKLPPSPAELEEIFRVLSGEQSHVVIEGLRAMNHPKQLKVNRQSGSIKGFITGGNLETFCSHLGTSLRPNTSGAIAVFEDWGERGYRIDRRLEQLIQSRVLSEKTKAVVFGEFLGGDEPNGTNKIWPVIERFATDWAEKNGVLVLRGMPFGHGGRSRVIPYGGKAHLELSSLSLTISTEVDGSLK